MQPRSGVVTLVAPVIVSVLLTILSSSFPCPVNAGANHLVGPEATLTEMPAFERSRASPSLIASDEVPEIGTGSSVGQVTKTLDLTNGSVFQGNYVPSASCVAPLGVAVDPTFDEGFLACAGIDRLVALDLTSGSLLGGVVVGADPSVALFDGQNGNVYVGTADGVTVVSSTNLTVVANIPVAGRVTYGLGYDNALGLLLVSDYNTDNLTEVYTSNNTIARSIPLPPGGSPWGVVFDPKDNDIFVAESTKLSVSVVSASSGSVVASVNLGQGPTALACDPSSGTVYVAEQPTDLQAISAETFKVIGTAELSWEPLALAVDNSTETVYAATNNVTSLNETTLAVTGYISVGNGPAGLALDSQSGDLYVADSASDEVDTVNLTLAETVARVTLNTGPEGLAVNSTGDDVYVSGSLSGTLTRLNGSSSALRSSTLLSYGLGGLATDPSTGHVYVTCGACDRVFDANSTGSVVGSTVVGSDPVAAAYDSVDRDVYVANENSDNISVINTTTDRVTRTIDLPGYYPVLIGANPSDVVFDAHTGDLYVTELGSIFGVSGSVIVVNASSGTVITQFSNWLNGTGSVAVDEQNNELYVADSDYNSVDAFNLSNYTLISQTPVGSGPQGVVVDPVNGNIYVANEGSQNVSVLNSLTNQTIGSIQVGYDPIGIVFDPHTDGLFVANQGSGTLSSVTLPVGYDILFSEVGLPSGTVWGISINNESETTTAGNVIAFPEPNGMYYYNVTLVAGHGYVPRPGTGSVTVTGSARTIGIIFSTVGSAKGFLGLPGSWGYTLLGGIGAAVVVVVVILSLRRARESR